jgi:AraC-like DNA-binding protein
MRSRWGAFTPACSGAAAAHSHLAGAALQWIEAGHALGSLNATQLAKALGGSRWPLGRIVTEYTGRGIRWHVAYARLLHAERLIDRSDLSLKEIAALAGFNSAAEFTRQFHTRRGVVPSAVKRHALDGEFQTSAKATGSAQRPPTTDDGSGTIVDDVRRSTCELKSGQTRYMRMTAAAVLVLAFALTSQAQSPPGNNRISGIGLSAEERRQIIAAVARSAFDTPDSWEDELSASRVDLGASPGIVLRGTKLLCGGTGNCQLFVMRKTNGTWVSLFGDEQAPLAESFELGPGATRGIKDLTVVTNSSAEASQKAAYRFDGQVYRRTTDRVVLVVIDSELT